MIKILLKTEIDLLRCEVVDVLIFFFSFEMSGTGVERLVIFFLWRVFVKGEFNNSSVWENKDTKSLFLHTKVRIIWNMKKTIMEFHSRPFVFATFHR